MLAGGQDECFHVTYWGHQGMQPGIPQVIQSVLACQSHIEVQVTKEKLSEVNTTCYVGSSCGLLSLWTQGLYPLWWGATRGRVQCTIAMAACRLKDSTRSIF